jgi:predicted GTPase
MNIDSKNNNTLVNVPDPPPSTHTTIGGVWLARLNLPEEVTNPNLPEEVTRQLNLPKFETTMIINPCNFMTAFPDHLKLLKSDHILIVGKAGSGKTTLFEYFAADIHVLLREVGSEQCRVSDQEYNGFMTVCLSFLRSGYRYYICDTPGLGDERLKWGEIKANMSRMLDDGAAGLHHKRGGIILCLRWDDRFNAYNGRLALDFCNSLGEEVWDKIIIAVTRCDILPPNIAMRKDPDCIIKYVEALKIQWKKVIQNELMKIKRVQQNVIADEQICFIDLHSKTGFNELRRSISTYISKSGDGR